MNITLKEIPEELHENLRRRAEANGRSLNKEVMMILQAVACPVKTTAQEILYEIKSYRDKMPLIVRDTELEQIISEGRE